MRWTDKQGNDHSFSLTEGHAYTLVGQVIHVTIDGKDVALQTFRNPWGALPDTSAQNAGQATNSKLEKGYTNYLLNTPGLLSDTDKKKVEAAIQDEGEGMMPVEWIKKIFVDVSVGGKLDVPQRGGGDLVQPGGGGDHHDHDDGGHHHPQHNNGGDQPSESYWDSHPGVQALAYTGVGLVAIGGAAACYNCLWNNKEVDDEVEK